jgi:hypothetical protein
VTVSCQIAPQMPMLSAVDGTPTIVLLTIWESYPDSGISANAIFLLDATQPNSLRLSAR